MSERQSNMHFKRHPIRAVTLFARADRLETHFPRESASTTRAAPARPTNSVSLQPFTWFTTKGVKQNRATHDEHRRLDPADNFGAFRHEGALSPCESAESMHPDFDALSRR